MKQFNQELPHVLDHVSDGVVKEAALYSLLNGGKRFRPQLLFATLEAYRLRSNKGLRAALALEMIHSYSLIHDDLPAMDDDTLRRGKATCHIKYGEDIAILAGDALLTESFKYANSATDNNNVNHFILDEVIQCSGLNGMIYGQELDIRNISNTTSVEELKKINVYKTAKLITLSFVLAALIADRQGDRETWVHVGKNIGLIFQIQDDILDINQTSEELGKDANSDHKNNKSTYASLLGEEQCIVIIQTLYDETLSLLDTLVIDKTPIVETLDNLLKRKK